MRGWLFFLQSNFHFLFTHVVKKRNILLIFMKKYIQILARGEEEVLFEGKLREKEKKIGGIKLF